MYLTASRPDIMFAVCACARFQVTPKASHLNAVKSIFRLRATYGAELVSAVSLVNTARPTLSTTKLSLCYLKVLHDGNDVWIRQIWCYQANLVLPGKFGAARQTFVLLVTDTTVGERNRFSLIKYNLSMANLEFVNQYSMVACLEKTEGNFDFHEIVDFLASSLIHHALTINAIVDSK
ncbi:hypothetical protein Tco_1267845, partial [Tanacetum coccineum]